MINMMVDITVILQAVIVLAAALATGFLLPFLQAKLDAEKLQRVHAFVSFAVEAAEQLYPGRNKGAAKLSYVKDFLAAQGVSFDDGVVETMIEAEVHRFLSFVEGGFYD
jgi:hypothetical protein